MTQVCTGLSAWVETEVVVTLGASSRMTVVRRCADLAEVVAASAAGRVDVVLLSPGLQGVDRSAVADLVDAGVAVVGIHRPLDESEERVLRQWGVQECLAADVALDELESAIDSALDAVDQSPGGDRQRSDGTSRKTSEKKPGRRTGRSAEGKSSGADGEAARAGADRVRADDRDDAGRAGDLAESPGQSADRGQVMVVWGPHGAPGRTSVAINLAAELDGLGEDTLLIDLDLHAPAIAQLLGLLDEAPGLAAAARLAEAGRLDVVSLAGVAPVVGRRTRVLTGLPRAARWPEIRPDAVRAVLAAGRSLAKNLVVDIAAPLEDDEELSYDTRAPRRNGAALAALEVADRVIAVGSADPIGLQRLVRDLDELRDRTDAPVQVVVTKVRSSAVGASARTAVAAALNRFAGLTDITLIADDRSAFDKAVLQGRTLAEVASESAARHDLRTLAAGLLGDPATAPARTRGLRRRLWGRLRSSAV